EIRLRNGVEDGDHLVDGGELRNAGLKKTIRAAAEYVREQGADPGPNRGWGIACGQWNLGRAAEGVIRPSAAQVKVNEDGTVVLNTGATESGGGQLTVLAQIVAEVLGVTLERVSVVASDTDTSPHDIATGGSRTTYQVGNTVRLAAEDARRQLLKLAAERWDTDPARLEVAEGIVRPKERSEPTVSIDTLARAALRSPAGPIMGSSTNLREELVASLGGDREVIDAPHYCTHAALVEVDRETGQVKVLRYLAAHDVGFAIHPIQVEGQIQGGVIFGLGYALTEEMITREGRVLNPDLLDYRLPTAISFPKIDMAIIEEPSSYGPFGVKPIGEPPTIPVAAAIANAIHSAVGARIRELPLSAERVLGALKGSLASS
ncbi:MAG: xanthine dehydrogenase family protein molybdopterin-binding subunit, partial [Dehalococcoidia bacterium]